MRVPDLDWIADDRTGLTFNDATSAVFAMDVDWSKVEKRPDDNEPHVLGVALDYDGRAYEVRVLDAYTAWLPRYRFSVVSDS